MFLFFIFFGSSFCFKGNVVSDKGNGVFYIVNKTKKCIKKRTKKYIKWHTRRLKSITQKKKLIDGLARHFKERA
jgi:hypothetical protein